MGSHGIEASWAGGKRGREVMDRFFPMVSQLLSKQGLFYLVTVSDNNPGRRIRDVAAITYLTVATTTNVLPKHSILLDALY